MPLNADPNARKPRSFRGAGAIPEGSRNAHLASLAGTMRRRGMGQDAIEAALQAENAGLSAATGDAEVRVIGSAVCRTPDLDKA